ncbi:MAG: DivIVA domain-containing protein [Clostridia bacterium]|nr:DivIVA domain-containing protein [Clostridia bacterium]
MSKKEKRSLFNKSFRGYDKEQVDLYVGSLEREIESLKGEVAGVTAKLEASEDRVDEYKRRDKLRGDIIAQAENEAERILTEAKGKAAREVIAAGRRCGRIVADMASKVDEQRRIYDATRDEVQRFRFELFRLYRDHIKKINAYAEAVGVFDADAPGAELEGFMKMLSVDNKSGEKEDGVKSSEPQKDGVPEETEYNDYDEFNSDDAGEKEEKSEEEREKLHENIAALGLDDEDAEEFGDAGPVGDAVAEYEGTESLDDVYGKTDSYSEAFEYEYGGDESKKPQHKLTKEEIIERRRRAEDDSNEFYAENDAEYDPNADPDIPTAEIKVVKPAVASDRRHKRWKIKRRTGIADSGDDAGSGEENE